MLVLARVEICLDTRVLNRASAAHNDSRVGDTVCYEMDVRKIGHRNRIITLTHPTSSHHICLR
jgi:hypothetical protein